MSKTEQILELVKSMTVVELAELVKQFEEEFGVSAQAVVAAPAAGAAAPEAAKPAEEEKTEFDVVPVSYTHLDVYKRQGEPNKKKVGKVTKNQVKEIAELKMKDLNAASLESAMRLIEGTARSMGIEVV